MSFKLNPFTGKMDRVGSSGASFTTGVAYNESTGVVYQTHQAAIDDLDGKSNESILFRSIYDDTALIDFTGITCTDCTIFADSSCVDENTTIGQIIVSATCTGLSIIGIGIYAVNRIGYQDNDSVSTTLSDCRFETSVPATISVIQLNGSATTQCFCRVCI